jgi:hypothetical protein
MSYIGVPPVSGDFVVLDAITTSATASYTLQRNSANFSPESANHMLVSLNGSIQKPNSSFTVSGSTITFSEALTSSDSIDFILVLGNVNAVGVATTVSDNAITDAKTNFVSTSSGAGLQIKGDGTTDGTLQLNCSQNSHGIKLKSPAHSAGQSYTLTFPTTSPSANKALITDGSGNLSFGSAGGLNLVHASSSSSAATSFTIDNVFTSTYDNYLMMMELDTSVAGGYYMRLLKSDGSERTSNYYIADMKLICASGTISSDSSQNVSTFYIGRSGGSDIGAPNRHLIHFYDPYSSSKYSTIFGTMFGYHDSLNEYVGAWQNGHNDNVETHRGFKMVANSGNIDEYDVKIWGFNNS